MKRFATGLAHLLLLLALWMGGHQMALAADQAAVPGNAPSNAQLDPAMVIRLRRLESELRCLVCQNQTLADSEAGLAQDLRNQVEELALKGMSDDEIKAWLRERYGDFVLYRPPVQPNTWLLWFGPFVVLIAALCYWFWRLARTRAKTAAELPKADRASFDAVIAAATHASGRISQN
jgi:cytochrome c-type biogenesis protein CcmH